MVGLGWKDCWVQRLVNVQVGKVFGSHGHSITVASTIALVSALICTHV
jgi:hypothetical protein